MALPGEPPVVAASFLYRGRDPKETRQRVAARVAGFPLAETGGSE